MYDWRISGLMVRSDINLPGVAPVPAGLKKPDVHIRVRPVPDHLAEPASAIVRGPVWDLDERRFLLRLPGIGRFLASDGSTLDIDPHPETTLADALPFALGTGFGALLLQRGGMVLHASAVALNGRAYVLCGHSGAGKSTLAAALCSRGCQFVNDDVCSVDLDRGGQPVLWPDGRRLKLFDESIAWLKLSHGPQDPVRAGTGKFYVDPPSPERTERESDGPFPLAGVYILRTQTSPPETGVELLSPLNGAQALLNHNYRPRLSMAMARKSRQPEVTAAIVQHVPVFRLFRPRDLGGVAQTAEELLTQWQSTR